MSYDILDPILDELLPLLKQKRLTGANLVKVKDLFVKMKELGNTNQQIHELVGGARSIPDIKRYTRNVKPIGTPHPQNITASVFELSQSNLTMRDVRSTLAVKAELGSNNMQLGDVVFLLSEARKYGMMVRDLLYSSQILRRSNLKLDDINRLLSLKNAMEYSGVSESDLTRLGAVSLALGGKASILRALEGLVELADIKASVEKQRAIKAELESQNESLRSTGARLKQENEEAVLASSLYQNLKKEGFHLANLKSIKEIAERHNGGIEVFLKGLEQYASIFDLENEIKDYEKEKHRLRQELDSISFELGGMKELRDLCKTLLEAEYGLVAVKRLNSVAEKFGKPSDVFSILDSYRDLLEINKQIEENAAKKASFESEIVAKEKRVGELSSQLEEINKSISSLFSSCLEKISIAFEGSAGKLTETYQSQLGSIKTASQEYAERLAALKVYDEELKIARVLSAGLHFPEEAKELPIDYAIGFLDVAAKICLAKSINPKITMKEAKIPVGPLCDSGEVTAIDLLVGAKMAFLSLQKGPSR